MSGASAVALGKLLTPLTRLTCSVETVGVLKSNYFSEACLCHKNIRDTLHASGQMQSTCT